MHAAHKRWFVVIVLFIVVGWLSGCTWGGMQSDAIYTSTLSKRTEDVPDGTKLHIELEPPYEVALRHDNKVAQLGTLDHQFPEAPLRTMLIDTGTDRFIVGSVDHSIVGSPTLVYFFIPDRAAPVVDAKAGAPHQRVFVIPIFAETEEVVYWDTISAIIIQSDSTPKTREEFAWRKTYEPPFVINDLWVVPTWPSVDNDMWW